MSTSTRRFFIRFTFAAAGAAALTSAGFVLAFTEPSGTPPGSDVPAPINVGGTPQIKGGVSAPHANGGVLQIQNFTGSGYLNFNSNQVWNPNGPLILNSFTSPFGGQNVGIGTQDPQGTLDIENATNDAALCLNGSCTQDISGGSNYWTLQNNGNILNNNSSGNVRIGGLLGVGTSCNGGTAPCSPTNGYPSGWGGGIHTFDIFAEGTLGAGTNGQEMAGLSSSGDGYIGRNLQVDNNANVGGTATISGFRSGDGNGLIVSGGGILANSYNNLGQSITAKKDIGAYGDICTLNPDGSDNTCLSSVSSSGSEWAERNDGNLKNTNANGNVDVINHLTVPGITSQWISGVVDIVDNFNSSSFARFMTIDAQNYCTYDQASCFSVGGIQGASVYAAIYAQDFCITSGKCLSGVSSDERLKTGIAPLTDSLSKIIELNPVSFHWINPDLHGGPQQNQGFIAQDVQKVFPQFVTQLDAQGADKNLVGTDGKEYALSLGTNIDAYMVGAIKEIAGRVNIQGATEAEPSILSTYQGSNIPAISIDASGNVEMAGNISAGSPTHPSGITLYDDENGQPYCVRMHGGELTQTSGACSNK